MCLNFKITNYFVILKFKHKISDLTTCYKRSEGRSGEVRKKETHIKLGRSGEVLHIMLRFKKNAALCAGLSGNPRKRPVIFLEKVCHFQSLTPNIGPLRRKMGGPREGPEGPAHSTRLAGDSSDRKPVWSKTRNLFFDQMSFRSDEFSIR